MAVKSKTGWVTIVSGVVIVLVLIIIHSMLDTQPSFLAAQKVITIGIEDNPMSSLAIIAQKEGLFKKLGINVRLVTYDSGVATLQALLNYKVDLATATNIPILVDAFKQTNFSIIATLTQAENMSKVVVRMGRGIQSPRDLIGKRIGTQANSSVDYYTYLFLKHYSIPLSDVQLLYLPAKKLVMALRSGYLDAFVMRSPYTDQAQDYMPGQISYFTIPGLFKIHFNLVVMNASLNAHRNKVRLVLKGLHDALLFEQQHIQSAQNDVIAFFGIERRDEVLQAWPQYQFMVSVPPDLITSLEKQSRWVIASGKGIASDKPNVAHLVNPGPLAAVEAGQFTHP